MQCTWVGSTLEHSLGLYTNQPELKLEPKLAWPVWFSYYLFYTITHYYAYIVYRFNIIVQVPPLIINLLIIFYMVVQTKNIKQNLSLNWLSLRRGHKLRLTWLVKHDSSSI